VLAFVPAATEMMHRYREVTVPLIIVVGDLDPFTTKEHSYRLHREVPGSTLVVLEQAGHMIPHLHPEAVEQAIHYLEKQGG
jgi:pimeloyl-ACP methyl ester carboxylesterase